MVNATIFKAFQDTDSFMISAFDLHMLFVIFLMLGSLMSIFTVYEYYRGFRGLWPSLIISFSFVGMIGLGELFEHTNFPMGIEFWHYFHIFSGIAALYFFYSFINRFELYLKEMKERRSSSAMPQQSGYVLEVFVASLFLIGGGFLAVDAHAITNLNFDLAVFVVLLALSAFILLKTYRKAGKITALLKSTFSLTLFFLVSLIYVIIGSLFLLVTAVNVMGVSANLGASFDYVVTVGRILQNMFYVMLTTIMVIFVIITAKADEFNPPLKGFS